MAKRKGKNTLIDSISGQTDTTVKTIENNNELSSISSDNKQLENKTEYECLTEDLATISDDSQLIVNLDSKASDEILEKLNNYEILTTELSVKVLTLENQNNILQDENDKCLMKISELTFENAKLNAQIQELSKSNSESQIRFNETTIPNSVETARKNTIKQTAKSVNYPYQPNAGYSSWN